MKLIRPSIRRKGLEQHATEYGVNYKKLVKQFEYGATDTRISKDTGISRNTMGKWRKVYEHEVKRAADDKAVDELRTD